MITYPLTMPYGNAIASNKREPVTNNPLPDTTSYGSSAINWDGIAKLFKDPRATPAFYKMALGLLTDLLSHQRGMEQLAIQRQMASARDLNPMLNFATNIDNQLNKLYETYAVIPDKNSPQALQMSEHINKLLNFRNNLYSYIGKQFGIPMEMLTPYDGGRNPQIPQQPQQKGSILGQLFGNLRQRLSAIPPQTIEGLHAESDYYLPLP